MKNQLTEQESPHILLVDDDETFNNILARTFSRRGWQVATANTYEQALQRIAEHTPEYAVIDLKLAEHSGLHLIQALTQADPHTRTVVLTGYASIATAVEAIKLGATHYLTKPANADDIIAALTKTEGNINTPVNHNPLSIDRLEWEHIQKVLAEHDGNISATARALNMHRRTLQRKLSKKPVRETE